MFCPQCGAEYKEGVAECADCEVALVDQPPPPPEHPEPDLVGVFETSQPALLPVVVSMLEAAGIDPVVEGDEVMGMLPVGQFGAGAWSQGGRGLSVVVRVAGERAEEARALLADVEEGAAPEEADDGQ